MKNLENRLKSHYGTAKFEIAIHATRILLDTAFEKFPRKTKLEIIAILINMQKNQLNKDLIRFVGLDMVTETHSEP